MNYFFKYTLIFTLVGVFSVLSLSEVSYRRNGEEGARLTLLVTSVKSFSLAGLSPLKQSALLVGGGEGGEDKVSPLPNEVVFVPQGNPTIFPGQAGQEKVALGFVGDIMLDRGVKGSVERRGGNYNYLFEKLFFPQTPDILFGNLEGPASLGGTEVGNLYSFKMDPKALAFLQEVGFDVLSLANNHIGDWGKVAGDETRKNILENGMTSSGWGKLSLEDALVIKEENSIKVGYLAFSDVGPTWLSATPDESGVYLATKENLEAFIPHAKERADILVVSYHFGDEYVTTSNKRQNYLAHTAIDLGANLVVGHHPHVIQEVEQYKEGLIAYSLGNFIFDQYFSLETMTGLVLLVDVDKDGVHSYTPGRVLLNDTFQIETLTWEEKIPL